MKGEQRRKRGGGVVGWMYTILWIASTIHSNAAVYLYGFPVGIVVGVLVNWTVAAAEVFVTPSVWDNWEVMKKNGYTAGYLLFCILANTGIVVAQTTFLYNHMPTLPSINFDLSFFLVVFFNFFFGEIAFTFGHRLIHSYFPKLHLLHHCCLFPSYTSNYFFDPLDLFIEFSFPGAVIQIMQVCVRNTPRI